MLSSHNQPQYFDHITPKMRGYTESGDTSGGQPLQRRPSKLMQMRDDYQKKIMKEKEEKMAQMYEESQRKAMEKARAVSGAHHNSAQQPGGKSVREFFQERRRLEQNGGTNIPTIDNHYRQAKGYSSPGGWSSRTGSAHSAKKTSAGRDRANPLAPINRRPVDTNEISGVNANNSFHPKHSAIPQSSPSKANFAGRSGIPQFSNNNALKASPHRQLNNGYHTPEDEDIFNGKPKLVKHRPLPPTNGNPNFSNNQRYSNAAQGDNTPSQPSNLPKFSPQHRKPPHPPAQKRAVHKQQQIPVANGGSPNGKMTDFQKWQLEQNKTREDRLKKLNSRVDDEDDGVWDPPTPRQKVQHSPINSASRIISGRDSVPISSRSKVIHNVEEEEEEEDYEYEEEEEGGDDQVAQLERELLAKIAREQEELERMRKKREKDEQEEAKERERKKKREAAERAKQKKIEEQERKEEERRQKEEEEEEKRERARLQKEEIQRSKDAEKRRKEEEKLTARRMKEEEKTRKAREKEEERFRKEEEKFRKEEEKRRQREEKLGANRQPAYKEKDNHYSERFSSEEEDNGYPSPGRTYTVSKTSRGQHSLGPSGSIDLDDRPAVGAGDNGSKFYMQAAADPEARASVGKLRPCGICGRKFAVDRLSKHQAACKKNSKPRKAFDVSKKRVEGTEAAKFVGKTKEVPKKKSNWRKNHEDFIKNLRYAKKADAYAKEGRDMRELEPPPVTENPDLVPCPHCNRTFNETAAARHIPRCADLKTRPKPMNTRMKR